MALPDGHAPAREPGTPPGTGSRGSRHRCHPPASGGRRFIAAARDGDIDGLIAVLDPDIVLRSDGGVLRPGASVTVCGAAAVAAQALALRRLHPLVRPALVNGTEGVVVAPRGQPSSVMAFTVRNARILEIDVLVNPECLRQLDLTVLGD